MQWTARMTVLLHAPEKFITENSVEQYELKSVQYNALVLSGLSF